jgi:hypothetical protein
MGGCVVLVGIVLALVGIGLALVGVVLGGVGPGCAVGDDEVVGTAVRDDVGRSEREPLGIGEALALEADLET